MTSDPWSHAAPPQGFAAGLTMGMLEAKRRDVQRAMQLRFGNNVPADLTAFIRACEDLDRLDRWLDAAITSPTLETFRAVIAWSDAAEQARS